MFERVEHPEKLASSRFDAALHRTFRPTDSSSEGHEQALESGKPESPQTGDWVDSGIQNVSLDAIDVQDSYVETPDDFKKVSHEEMTRGMEVLESEVRPAVEQGFDADHFREVDQARGVDYAHGTQRVYEAFYGDEPIRLNRIGDRYEVVNGYHRLYVAREMGLDTVPARVIEKRS